MVASDSDLALRDDRFPGARVARRLMLRWTELEVHRSDLLAATDPPIWAPSFVRFALPLRIAWQPLARRLPTAALDVTGTWALRATDRVERWLVHATAGNAVASRAVAAANVELAGSSGLLLAFVLGRLPSTELQITGDAGMAAKYKLAFPGP